MEILCSFVNLVWRSNFNNSKPMYKCEEQYRSHFALHDRKVKSSMAKSPPVENLATVVRLIIIYLQYCYWSSSWAAPCSSRPQPATDNGARDGKFNRLAVTSHLTGQCPLSFTCICTARYKSENLHSAETRTATSGMDTRPPRYQCGYSGLRCCSTGMRPFAGTR